MKEFVLSAQPGAKTSIDYENELNQEQLGVVLNGDGHTLVLAGAGSGKTRTVTYRVAYLLEQGVPAEEILLLTFTNKAAREMIERIQNLLGTYPTGLWGGTFHSVANRILRQYATHVGYTPTFTIMDRDDSKDLIKYCLKDLKIDTKARRFPSPAVLQSLISYQRNAAMSMEEVVEAKHPNFLELVGTIERVADVYATRKRTANAMDFDDLLLLLSEILNSNPTVRQALAERFRYVLVDEYQDTNVIQAGIVRSLSSVHNNLLVVGDDAQSIYSFRAAEIENILGFGDQYPSTKIYRLETNYRSTPEILTLANSVIGNNREQYEKSLRPVLDSFEKPNLVPTANTQQEAQYIAEQILSLRDEGVPLEEISVLFRAAHHSQALELELARRDIPYEYRGGMKFFERAHIKDIVAHLRLVTNPKDAMAWVRVLSLQVGIGAVTAGKIADAMQQIETLEEILDFDTTGLVKGRADTGWQAIYGIIKRMLKTDKSPAALIRAVASSTYRDYLEAEYPNYLDRLEDIEQFAIFSEQYQDLTQFLEEVSLKDDYGAVREEAPRNDEKMVLSTIHQAKGLEWHVVFVMNAADNAFPHPRALNEEGGVEEERRLFYVAVTRAKKHLFVSYPIMSGYDALELRQPSMFLQEVPNDLFEEVKLRRSFGVSTKPRYSNSSNGGYQEPTIVLDSMGEVKSKPKIGGGFLRNIDEL